MRRRLTLQSGGKRQPNFMSAPMSIGQTSPWIKPPMALIVTFYGTKPRRRSRFQTSRWSDFHERNFKSIAADAINGQASLSVDSLRSSNAYLMSFLGQLRLVHRRGPHANTKANTLDAELARVNERLTTRHTTMPPTPANQPTHRPASADSQDLRGQVGTAFGEGIQEGADNIRAGSAAPSTAIVGTGVANCPLAGLGHRPGRRLIYFWPLVGLRLQSHNDYEAAHWVSLFRGSSPPRRIANLIALNRRRPSVRLRHQLALLGLFGGQRNELPASILAWSKTGRRQQTWGDRLLQSADTYFKAKARRSERRKPATTHREPRHKERSPIGQTSAICSRQTGQA